METKELILLMLIPVILVGIIAYINTSQIAKSPAITGAVSEQEKQSNIIGAKQSNIIGTYSILPSFKAKIDYNLDVYSDIKKMFEQIYKCASEGNSLQDCVDNINSNNNDFKWELNCDKGAQRALYDFAEFYRDCFDSEDDNCLCRKDMALSDEELKKYGLLNKRYKMSLAQNQYDSSNQIEIKMSEPSLDLSYNIVTDIKLRSIWYPNSLVLAYVENKIEMIFKNIIEGTEYYYSLPSGKKELIAYKHKINNINSVDFVKKEGDDLFYPNNKQIEIKNIPDCEINPKNIYRFCVTKKGSEIKFASYVPTLPQPLKDVHVYDRPKAEKSVLIKWDKSPFKDVTKYRIYYADSNLNIFEKTPTRDLRKNSNVIVKQLEIASAKIEELNSPINPNQKNEIDCEFDYQSKQCIFSTTSGERISIGSDKLYYFKQSNSYIYNLILPEDNKNYDFAVAGVDKNNNEIDNINQNQKLPVIKATQSIDDLPPNSDKIVSSTPIDYDVSLKKVAFVFRDIPSRNIDGSEAKDAGNYRVYYKKFDKLETDEKIKKELDNMKESYLKDLSRIQAVFDPRQQNSQLSFMIESQNPQTGNIFFFVVVAEDTSGNPKDSKFKVKELGAEILRLTIP